MPAYTARQIVEFAMTYFAAINAENFSHVFKLSADAVAAFLQTSKPVRNLIILITIL